MKWKFTPLPQYLVETEVTQRDQFNTDQTGLSETLLREAVQNSLDAAPDPNNIQVRVSFRWVGPEDGLDPGFIRDVYEGHLDHARSAGVDIDRVDFDSPTALVIEDFGTCGLTGAVDEKDNENFSDFWRRHGKSHKSGKARGRWGLGKLVYSCSSRLSSFFGMTVREEDASVYLMGQTVLGIHDLDDIQYPTHSFYSDFKDDDESNLQVPITDGEQLARFSENFCLERREQPGLSVIIPFPIPDLRPESMIGTGINNYFYPIIMDQLVLDVGGTVITSQNIRELANQYLADEEDISEIFDFIFQMKEANEHALPEINESWSDDLKLDEDDVDDGLLQEMRMKFANGELVGVKLPITITRKDGTEIRTGFSVFVKRPENLTKGKDLYLRGGLTLPEERKFGERKALGALVAGEENIADFLGNAENAAHTKWDAFAEKLHKNYLKPSNALRVIRHSVVNFFDMLAQSVDEEDESALMEFFWEETPGHKDKPRKAGPTGGGEIDEPPEPKPKPCSLNRIEGGFSVTPGKDIGIFSFPFRIRVRACYDTGSGNPFRKFDPLDFDFRKKGGLSIRSSGGALKATDREANMLELEVLEPEFVLHVTGFDPNRDLLLKLNTVEV